MWLNRARVLSLSSILLIMLLAGGLFLLPGMDSVPGNGFSVHRIAHAGGALGELRYTNSLEAMDDSLASGFRYFEIDLLSTHDNYIVCGHDWADDRGHLRWGELAPGMDEFLERTSKELPFTRCTIGSLMAWLGQTSSASLVPDIKEDNLSILRHIAEHYPQQIHQVIPQIYFPEEFGVVRGLGFHQVIWTLYRYDGSDSDILTAVRSFSPPFAVALNVRRARNREFLGELSKLDIPVYVHTINDERIVEDLMKRRLVREIYTDYLAPGAR